MNRCHVIDIIIQLNNMNPKTVPHEAEDLLSRVLYRSPISRSRKHALDQTYTIKFTDGEITDLREKKQH